MEFDDGPFAIFSYFDCPNSNFLSEWPFSLEAKTKFLIENGKLSSRVFKQNGSSFTGQIYDDSYRHMEYYNFRGVATNTIYEFFDDLEFRFLENPPNCGFLVGHVGRKLDHDSWIDFAEWGRHAEKFTDQSFPQGKWDLLLLSKSLAEKHNFLGFKRSDVLEEDSLYRF